LSGETVVGGVTGLIVGGGIGGTCGALKEGFLEFHPFAGPRRNAAYARVLGEGGGCKRDSKQYTDADLATKSDLSLAGGLRGFRCEGSRSGWR